MTLDTEREPMLYLAACARRITGHAGAKRRAGPTGWAYVPWRYLDQLADALRAAGIDPAAENLGADAYAHAVELHERKLERGSEALKALAASNREGGTSRLEVLEVTEG